MENTAFEVREKKKNGTDDLEDSKKSYDDCNWYIN